MSQEQEHSKNLTQARNEDKNTKSNPIKKQANAPKKTVRQMISMVTSILSSIEIRDVFFMFAIMMAMLKDISDYVGIGSLPLIGTAITLMASITITVGILVSGNVKMFSKKDSKFATKKAIRKWLILFGGTLMEIVFGINFLPIETIVAVLTFGLTLLERAGLKEEVLGNEGEEEGGGEEEDEEEEEAPYDPMERTGGLDDLDELDEFND